MTMLDKNPYKPNIVLGLLLGAWSVVGLLWVVISPLQGEEAYLWFSSTDLVWGTIDGSVLSQFFAWLGNLIGGETHVGVRLFFILAQVSSIYLFYDLTHDRSDSSLDDIPLYLVLFLAMPIVQLNSTHAVEWAALMLTVSLLLWAYRRFIEDHNVVNIAVLGFSLALMSWSDYRGLLVLTAILGCNIRLLINWRFWVAIAVSLLIVAPTIWWQCDHGWPMVDLHIAIYDELRLRDMASDLFKMLLRFNPLLLIPFIVVISTRKGSSDIMAKTMRSIFWIFSVAVVWGAFVGMSLGIMAGPILFSMVYVLIAETKKSKAFRRYILLASVFSSVFLFGIRSALLIKEYESPTLTDAMSHCVSDTMRNRGVELIITAGNTSNASLLNFYGEIPAWAMPTMRSGFNRYAQHDITDNFAGKKVAIEVDIEQSEKQGRDSLLGQFWKIDMPSGEVSYMKVIENFRPQNRVRIEPAHLPEKILTGSLMAVTLTVRNPYPYEIPMGKGEGKSRFVLQFRSSTTGRMIDVDLPFKILFLSPSSEAVIATTARIPIVPTDIYSIAFILKEDHLPSVTHSKIRKIQIVNPKSRI